MNQSIPRRFEQQVEKYPDRLALKTLGRSVTYRDLNRMANRIAHAIIGSFRDVGQPVALIPGRDALPIAALLAVLKAGRILVPLDLERPRSLTHQILEDSGARLILAKQEHIAATRELAPQAVSVLNIDELRSGLSHENPDLVISPGATAWILYTSGTTGAPKGVMQTHRDELHNIMTVTNSHYFSSSDRMTLLRNLSVAGAIRNLFSALLNGTALFPYDMKKMGLAGLAELLIREQITVFHSSASLFRSFVQQLTGSEQFPKLRLIRLGSEPVMWTDVELFNKHFSPQCTLVNALSSTEARTYLQYFVDTQSEIRAGVLPVGFPVDDTEVLIFDDNDRPLPPGETGEMVLRTPCVFPGYWKHDTDVRKEIVTDPERMGGLLLRTGDLGYRRPDGCLVHVGRKDFQTKIRGHRVELAEVETALLDIAGIKHAVVLALEDGSGGARLTAYVVPYDGQILTASRLRASLQEKLPAYVIPASFVILDSLPLTASGKVDRRALPPPDRSRHQLDGPYAAPKNPIEKVLVNLWAEVLGVAEIGVHDDFIELGGDSLLGARIVARVNESFSPKNPLKILFETPTVAKLCAFLREQESSPGQAEKDAEILLQAESPSVDAMRHSFEK